MVAKHLRRGRVALEDFTPFEIHYEYRFAQAVEGGLQQLSALAQRLLGRLYLRDVHHDPAELRVFAFGTRLGVHIVAEPNDPTIRRDQAVFHRLGSARFLDRSLRSLGPLAIFGVKVVRPEIRSLKPQVGGIAQNSLHSFTHKGSPEAR